MKTLEKLDPGEVSYSKSLVTSRFDPGSTNKSLAGGNPPIFSRWYSPSKLKLDFPASYRSVTGVLFGGKPENQERVTWLNPSGKKQRKILPRRYQLVGGFNPFEKY